MDSEAMELYIYMCSYEPVIVWLKKENVKTKKEAIEKLRPFVKSNIIGVATHLREGNYGVSLAGANSCIKKVLEAFPE